MYLSGFNTTNDSHQVTNSPEDCFFLHTVIFDKENTGLYYTSIVTIVVNSIFAVVAALGNILFLQTLWRTSSLQTPSNILLGNLALSDLLVGLIVQPLYIGYKTGEINGRYSCPVHVSFSTVAWLAVGVSFLSLTAISLERYMAIFKSFRYLAIVQVKTVLTVSVFTWVLTFTVVFSRFLGLSSFYFHAICLVFIIVSFTTTIVVYVKIYRVAKQHQRSIRDQSTTANDNKGENGENFVKEAKMTKTVGMITGLFFLCYLPTLGIMVYYSIKGYSTIIKTLYSWTDTLVFVNSSFNPVVYYLRNRNIRQALLKFVWTKHVKQTVKISSSKHPDIASNAKDS